MARSVKSNSEPSHSLGRVTDQPSEDFMTLKDPFASPNQAGIPLPPSPPRTAPLRRPRRRASEPLQLRRFGSFAVFAEDVKEKQAGAEEDQDTSFIEDLVRHAWLSTGCTDSNSTRNGFHECGSLSSPVNNYECSPISTRTSVNSSAIRDPRLELPGASELASSSIQVMDPSWTSKVPKFSGPRAPPSLTASTYLPTYIEPPSPASSESGSSFVSPPPTPTPGPSSHRLPPRSHNLASNKHPRIRTDRPFCP
ncbi:hypothetical protein RSOLAG1IB_04172 [Rhizoctonia solani AG-1 IB]|uniref:Uncharacterized protein n=1 Tax=Thanatephorus cucumeris (strain AG1-IB / isolate 7/3/14) TaxID=1108050 RepID=A0A0B7FXG6_THACB|nr:hypothetical protein RSOLAG1IB_04172 [Rhizoctonia solani AG-1 IB]